jgi:hypothetical protein
MEVPGPAGLGPNGPGSHHVTGPDARPSLFQPRQIA